MNKCYFLKRVDNNPKLHSEIWAGIDKAELNHNNFCGADVIAPIVTAQAVCSIDGITVKFESDEKNPIMRYSHSNQPAWLDSCVEFFFAPYPDKDGTYFNFEQSLGGALLVQKGTNSADRIYIPHSDDYFHTEREIHNDGWSIQFFIPFGFIDKHFETTNKEFYGNFQFCCEEKDVYLTWNKIENPVPAFHKPAYFGKLELDMSILDRLHAECVRNDSYHVYRICEMTKEDEIKVCEPVPSADLHKVYSITKCVVSILTGMLQDRGMLSVQDKVADYLSEYFPENVDPKWFDVSIADVLHHRNGGSGGGLYNQHVYENKPGDKDFLYYIFCDKLPYEIGKEIVYCDSNYYIISRIIEKVTGKKTDEWALENLFNPLLFESPAWPRCPQGHSLGGSGLCLRTQDIAKLGWL